MVINEKEQLTAALISRVVENAQVREIIRVYGEAVTAAVEKLSDEELAKCLVDAGYIDLYNAFVEDDELVIEKEEE